MMNFSTDNQKIQIATLAFIAGVIVAFIFYPKPEFETVYKTRTKVETDTIYSRSIDTVFINQTKIKTEFLRDTVLIDFKPKISRFETSFPFEYGSTSVSGEVLGEVLKMTAVNDYNLPVVTNTITVDKTSTIVVKPKGIYLGAGINSLLQPSAKVSYLDNKYLFSYQIEPFQKVHQISVSKKLF
jgi:hypothetical protein